GSDSRKGRGDESSFGHNSQSWSLQCSPTSLSFWHNKIQTEISAPPSSRIGVYVDHSAGTLSFYSVSDTMTLLHTVHTTFTQPLITLQGKMAEASISVDQDRFTCPVCLDLLKDPVTIPCGHSYCMVCINGCWDQEDQRRVYSCPQCRETFTPRPVLRRNNMLAEVVEEVKKKLRAAPPAPCYAGPGDVECDFCTGRKLKAVKSCLVCLASFCEAHLKKTSLSVGLLPLRSTSWSRASKQLQEKICSQHDEVMKIYCRTDQQLICYLCTMDEHMGHSTVAAAAERKEKQNQLKEVKKKSQQRLQEKEKKLQEVKQAVKTLKSSAQAAVEDSERIFTQLIRSIEKKHSEVTELIRAQEKTELSRAEELLKQLDEEIAVVLWRDTELEQLGHTKDHIQFLQSFQSLCVSSGSEDSPSITVHQRPSFDGVRKSLSDLKERLEEFCKQEFSKIASHGKRIFLLWNRMMEIFTCSEKMAEASISVDQDRFTCPVCLDLLKDPVTTPCGHSYCILCINGCWDQEDQRGVYSCPQCRETFTPRPVLRRSNMLTEVVEDVKQKLQAAPCYAGPGDVECDSCTGKKRKASKSCLVCLTSYCEAHLKPHYQSPAFKKHKLVEASKQLQEKICSQHDRVMKIYCRTDQKLICYLCTKDEHRDHDTVTAAAERSEKQKQVKQMQKKSQQILQRKLMRLQEVKQTVNSVKSSAQAAVEDSERIFTQLIRSIEKKRSEVTELIRAQEKTELSRAEELLEKLEQEIADLKRRDTELEQLEHTEDHIQFLQSFQSLCVSSGSEDSPSITVHQHPSFDGVRKSLSDLKERIEEFWKQEFSKIPPHDYCRLTLDPNTAHQNLRVFEENRVVKNCRGNQPYPDHPERFDYWPQVLSKESVSGRCYWEVEWSSLGSDVYISVSYKGISRKGQDEEFCVSRKMAEASISVSQDRFTCIVCLDLLKDPVTTPCGHSYCMVCINGYWDLEDQRGVYSCPQCRETFTTRPVLRRNNMLAEVVEDVKKKLQTAPPPAHCYAGPGDVECDFCTGQKLKAVKSCLVCLASYCEPHLKPHYQSPAFKKHKLVEASKQLQGKICSQHDEVMKIYCRTDQRFICYLCLKDEHRGHDTVEAAAERSEKQKQIKQMQKKSQQILQRKLMNLQEVKQTVNSVKSSAQAAVEDSERIFTQLIRSIEKKRSEVTELIRAQEKAELSRAEELLEKLEQEIADLKRRDTELEQLEHTEDHIQFLQSFQSLCVSSGSKDSPSITVLQRPSFDGVRKSLSDLKERLEEFWKQEIASNAAAVQMLLPSEPNTREEFLQYYCRLTLDPNTVNQYLSLFEENRAVVNSGEDEPYPDHPERFDYWEQVLSKESVSGRCYWEVEWSSSLWGMLSISVSYKGIRRKGRGDESKFGHNSQSWSLKCSRLSLSFNDNHIQTQLSAPPSSRIGVYVDHSAGTLSFYSISDAMTLLHTVHTTFTQPLHAGFWVTGGSKGSRSICGSRKLHCSQSALISESVRGGKWQSPDFKKHKLVEASKQLQEKIRSQHDRLIEIYCHYCELTLDPITVNQYLVLSEENRRLAFSGVHQCYSDCPDRFDLWPQVLSKESVSGRCYWEVEWSSNKGYEMYISVSYKGVGRKGDGNDSWFGHNSQSWSLQCSPIISFYHKNLQTFISDSASSRIGVYVDHSAGTLSFYSVSDTMTLLHTVHTTFTQPLYAGFWVNGRIGVSECCPLSLTLSVCECRKMAEASISVDQDRFSCPVCLDLLKDPVTIHCGHSFCMVCINGCWDQEDQRRVYSCPQCRETFTPRPVLRRNNMLAEVVEKLKKKLRAAPPAPCYAGPGDVECDFCTGRKLKASKCCLVCVASYCEAHLKPHYQSPTFKKHKLVEASKHKGHSTVAAAAERKEKQKRLKKEQRKSQQRLQEKEKELKEVKQAVKTLKSSAQAAVEDSERIFTQLICSIEKKRSEVTELIRAQEKTELSRAEELLEKLEQEIADLKRRGTELEQLEHTEDHIQFLQSFQSLCVSSGSEDSPSTTVHHHPSFDGVRKSLFDLKERLEEFWKQEFSKIPTHDYCRLTLDPNTVNQYLVLSEENRVVTFSGIKQRYPDHPERFDSRFQVLSKESVSGRCYWEVEWSNSWECDLYISVSYKGIRRKGWGKECWFGHNSQSWSLKRSPSSLSFWHNNVQTKLSAPPSSRIGVYVDHRAGTLSFYSVSKTKTLLHTVHTTFTQPLYAGFWIDGWYGFSGGSVRLCDLK
ncbi:hypothetical protein NFI96_022235, partial [Prochilodus magdalenae]